VRWKRARYLRRRSASLGVFLERREAAKRVRVVSMILYRGWGAEGEVAVAVDLLGIGVAGVQ
jgi:hypothetical protein